VIVTLVPPEVEPLAGETEVTVGALQSANASGTVPRKEQATTIAKIAAKRED
jgi:hypothetical protein